MYCSNENVDLFILEWNLILGKRMISQKVGAHELNKFCDGWGGVFILKLFLPPIESPFWLNFKPGAINK